MRTATCVLLSLVLTGCGDLEKLYDWNNPNNYAPAHYTYKGKTYVRHVCFYFWGRPNFDWEGQIRSDEYFRKQDERSNTGVEAN